MFEILSPQFRRDSYAVGRERAFPEGQTRLVVCTAFTLVDLLR